MPRLSFFRFMPVASIILLAAFLVALPARAQLITMSKDCKAQVASASAAAASRDFGKALETYNAIVEDCDTKDGVEAIQVGIANAQNGLGNYEAAIGAANVAYESSKETSINALFERARAEESLGRLDAATADYDRMIELTEMNQNVQERAILYAKVANMNYRAGRKNDADTYIAKARELDPDNPDFLIEQGDWAANDGDYGRAFQFYDQAVANGRTDADMYAIRSDARISMLQQKYGTDNVQSLRSQMTPEEKNLVCADSRKALDLGLRDMQMDMFVALVCK